MELNVVWFILITVLFTGFFLLEGFDYGVGTLLPWLSGRDEDRRMILRSIAPVWNGNEVWMLTAGGALFAAFPHVYATMFSTFYLALFLMLLALILRGVGFELRSHHESFTWRAVWDYAIFLGSALPAILWGVAVTNLMQGLPIDGNKIFTGGFFDLLSPYTILGGLTFFMVFTYHGAAFLLLKLSDEVLLEKVRGVARTTGAAAIVLFVLFIVGTYMCTDVFSSVAAVVVLLAAAAVFVAGYLRSRQGGGGFAFSSLAIVLTTVAVFAGLFPNIMISSLNADWNLTIYNACSTPYTLSIMTIAACCLVPVVLIYQGLSYRLFRQRITPRDIEQGHY